MKKVIVVLILSAMAIHANSYTKGNFYSKNKNNYNLLDQPYKTKVNCINKNSAKTLFDKSNNGRGCPSNAGFACNIISDRFSDGC